MRNQKRNQIDIYYALYEGKVEVKDEDGFDTGEYELSYSDPVKIKMCVSLPTGDKEHSPFGDFTDYDRIMTTNEDHPINENSILWIDRTPDEKHDYIVMKKAKSLNTTIYAIKQVI